MNSIPLDRLLAPDSIAGAALRRDERVSDLVAPFDLTAVTAAARTAAARDLPRRALADALTACAREHEAAPASSAAAARFAVPGVVAVVAGQQPGLFGGPQLCVWKALAAVVLARQIEAAGIPAVPVFWLATEDHDHDEADHVTFAWRRAATALRLPLPGDRRMLSHVTVPADAPALIAQATAVLPDGPGRAEVEALLAVHDGESFGLWSARSLVALLGPLGVAFVEPRFLRPLAGAVAAFEFAHPGALFREVRAANETVRGRGLVPPLDLRRETLIFSVDASGRRSSMTITGDDVRMRDSPPRSRQDVAAEIAADPQRASWDVATRVLAQNTALPVAAQICGPAEFGYTALLGAAHARLGIPRSLSVLRPGITLVSSAARRAARALEVDAADVVIDGASAVPVAAVPAAESLSAARAALVALPDGQSSGVERRRREALRQFELFAAGLAREHAESDAVRARRVEELLLTCRPGGHLAERVHSLLPWVAAQGMDLVGRVLSKLTEAADDSGGPRHHVIHVGEDL